MKRVSYLFILLLILSVISLSVGRQISLGTNCLVEEKVRHNYFGNQEFQDFSVSYYPPQR